MGQCFYSSAFPRLPQIMWYVEEHCLQEQSEKDPGVVAVVPHRLCGFSADFRILRILFSNERCFHETIIIQLTIFVFVKLALYRLPEVLARSNQNGKCKEKQHCEFIMEAKEDIVNVCRSRFHEAAEGAH
ncbi:g1.1 [Ichnoviriform fugitivi]|uniref:G1.1 n=1 Tax=Ichnoviriform fugitivi TaxID=265522 RepID=A2Q0P5_9VIRU|nr:g1.1 [Ichnoviriform fugitivi]BAF45760.1 g1.1 [Ichnoviriform fugitivi]